MALWNEQREFIKTLFSEHLETKNKEIGLLKNQIEILQKEFECSRKLNESNLQNVLKSIEGQMSLLKERELFTVSQLLEVEEKFAGYRKEKERMILLLKEEIAEVKGHNMLLSKIKSDK